MPIKTILTAALTVTLTLLSTLLFANQATEAQKTSEASNEKATLIIHRAKMSPPLAFKPLITINAVKAFYLPKGHHAELTLDPGEYTILADWKPQHGVADREITIQLQPGDAKAIEIKNKLDLSSIGTTNSQLASDQTNDIDLSKSTKISLWHPQWLLGSTAESEYTEPESLHRRYNLRIDTQLLIDDYKSAGDQQKLTLIKFLAKHHIFEDEILDVVHSDVTLNYQKAFETKLAYAPFVHMCKYLARTRNPAFQDTLINVANESPVKRVQKYARSFLRDFYGLELGKS